MSPAPNTPPSRVVSTGLVAAGLFAAIIGANGAAADGGSAPDVDPTGTSQLAEPSPTPEETATPTPTPTPEPEPAPKPKPKPAPAAEKPAPSADDKASKDDDAPADADAGDKAADADAGTTAAGKDTTKADAGTDGAPATADDGTPGDDAPAADADAATDPAAITNDLDRPAATPDPAVTGTPQPPAPAADPAAAAGVPAPQATPQPLPSPTPAASPRSAPAPAPADADCATTAGVVTGAEGALSGGAPARMTSRFPSADAPAADCATPDEQPTAKDRHHGPAGRGGKRDGKVPHHAPKPDKPAAAKPAPNEPVAPVSPGGAPTTANPGYSLAQPGPARIGVPNFFIDKFRIPPFLLPIYQAAGIQYGVRWEVLAAINEIETDYGRNLNISSAGALGWMQFMPATWDMYGVDANKDGVKDPFNPVDAIFASARYLRAAGADTDLRKAIFAYNHADWYVDSVLMRARLISGLPGGFVGSLTGLTQGRFPVHARATYAGSLDEGDRTKKVKDGNAAYIVQSDGERRGIDIFARKGAPVVAVNDGRISRIGTSERLGRFVQLQDVYGNTYTYAHLGEVAETYPAPRERKVSKAEVSRELDLPRDAKPKAPASATAKHKRKGKAKGDAAGRRKGRPAKETVTFKRRTVANPRPGAAKERLFAHPARPNARKAGGERQLGPVDYDPAADDLLRFDPKHYVAKPLRKGARVIAGTMLGRIGEKTPTTASHLHFEVRPAGQGAPRIDPKPILDGWKLLESTAIYRARGKNPFFGDDAATPSIGQILLMSKEALERRVLENPRIDIYQCGRDDVRSGAVDRRVLATLEFLAASGLRPTVSSMRCGHGLMTASGNISEHSTGDAVDIAAVNGVPIIGHQGRGSITELTIRKLLDLQGTMKPHQIISLMTFDGTDNTMALGDHDDHIHVGWRPMYGATAASARKTDAVLKPKQWIKLIDRLGEIDNPDVRLTPSKYSVKVVRRASRP
ncbi:MAG TPA: peptidoglycan DD-metalloendopeptidase family protein [Solirubrobacteraceae bacterium]|jgi:hypothetical protein